TPHAFTGFDRSVQFTVSLFHVVVVKPRTPMPERMFQVATLNARSGRPRCVAPTERADSANRAIAAAAGGGTRITLFKHCLLDDHRPVDVRRFDDEVVAMGQL